KAREPAEKAVSEVGGRLSLAEPAKKAVSDFDGRLPLPDLIQTAVSTSPAPRRSQPQKKKINHQTARHSSSFP
ncbi:hypothetical protein, partial [Paenibacillus ferrarius]|uniref:hypothetical protein n=1 Tax=Paenibacillus ferrarius TaxID=1469647 RepID=UPI001ABF887B